MQAQFDGHDFQAWLSSAPDMLKSDPLWRVQVYRMALFAAEVGWTDVTHLAADSRTRSLSDQLCRSLGGVSACIAEGYSRGTGRDRARFYEYALGSAREARDWYYKGRHVIGDDAATVRMDLLSRIAKLLITMIPDQRGSAIREEAAEYNANSCPGTDDRAPVDADTRCSRTQATEPF